MFGLHDCIFAKTISVIQNLFCDEGSVQITIANSSRRFLHPKWWWKVRESKSPSFRFKTLWEFAQNDDLRWFPAIFSKYRRVGYYDYFKRLLRLFQRLLFPSKGLVHHPTETTIYSKRTSTYPWSIPQESPISLKQPISSNFADVFFRSFSDHQVAHKADAQAAARVLNACSRYEMVEIINGVVNPISIGGYNPSYPFIRSFIGVGNCVCVFFPPPLFLFER